MKLKLAVTLMLGVALGIGTSNLLRAQAKPPAYLVSDITVTDQTKYEAWRGRIAPTFQQHGAKYLARGGQVMPVTGGGDQLPKTAVIIQFENMDKAKAWDSSEEAKAARAIDRGATFRSYIVEGVQPQ